ncbi:MAG: TlyA family RNA methyltransferase [Clostridia bacterium]|nr:TlyA family RNA methyltransferase [Clostridia bacterium]
MEKERLDILLVKKGLFQSREKARSAIMAGIVFVNKIKEDKPGTKFPEDCQVDIKENINPYVSRGGLKLEKALKTFGIDLVGKTAMDIGASTGGFTDCMLKNGAVKVYAVDVGYGQLAWELRNDERVVCMERTNIRYVKPDDIGELLDFASIDVSFISLKKVLPAAKEIIKADGEIMCLIKPQFEAGREKVGKHGVVREAETHIQVINEIVSFCIESSLSFKGLDYSPIKGPEGNIEYLLYLANTQSQSNSSDLVEITNKVVAAAHGNLN